jgi:hypothetical protein
MLHELRKREAGLPANVEDTEETLLIVLVCAGAED